MIIDLFKVEDKMNEWQILNDASAAVDWGVDKLTDLHMNRQDPNLSSITAAHTTCFSLCPATGKAAQPLSSGYWALLKRK